MLHNYNDDPRHFWGIQRTQFLDLLLDHAHLRTWELQIFFPDIIPTMRELRSVCFFRNPVSRFVSAIYEHHTQYRPEVQLPSLPWSEQQRVARSFTRDFEIHQAFSTLDYIHFSPQTWFTHLGKERLVKTIIPLVNGFDAFRAARMFLELPDHIEHEHARPSRDAEDLLGRDLIERVRRLYEADYEFCLDHDHLRPLADL
jgi:hypothetical protein